MLKNSSILLNLGVLLLIIWVPVHPILAQTIDTSQTFNQPDTTRYANLTIGIKNQSDSIYVVVDKRFGNPLHIKNNGTIHLPPGKYNLTIASKYLPDISFPVKVRPGENQTVPIPYVWLKNRKVYERNSSYRVLHEGINVEILTDVDSRVIINDSTYGYGNTKLMLKKGRYRVITMQPGIGQSVKVIEVQSNPPRYQKLTMYNKLNVWTVRMVGFIPGGAQFLKKDMTKAKLLFAGLSIGVIAGKHYNKLFESRRSAFDNTLEEYKNSHNESRALQLGNQTDELYHKAQIAQRNRNIVAGSVAALYLYNLLDAWLNTPKGGYRNSDNRKTRVQAYLTPTHSGLQVTIPFR